MPAAKKRNKKKDAEVLRICSSPHKLPTWFDKLYEHCCALDEITDAQQAVQLATAWSPDWHPTELPVQEFGRDYTTDTSSFLILPESLLNGQVYRKGTFSSAKKKPSKAGLKIKRYRDSRICYVTPDLVSAMAYAGTDQTYINPAEATYPTIVQYQLPDSNILVINTMKREVIGEMAENFLFVQNHLVEMANSKKGGKGGSKKLTLPQHTAVVEMVEEYYLEFFRTIEDKGVKQRLTTKISKMLAFVDDVLLNLHVGYGVRAVWVGPKNRARTEIQDYNFDAQVQAYHQLMGIEDDKYNVHTRQADCEKMAEQGECIRTSIFAVDFAIHPVMLAYFSRRFTGSPVALGAGKLASFCWGDECTTHHSEIMIAPRSGIIPVKAIPVTKLYPEAVSRDEFVNSLMLYEPRPMLQALFEWLPVNHLKKDQETYMLKALQEKKVAIAQQKINEQASPATPIPVVDPQSPLSPPSPQYVPEGSGGDESLGSTATVHLRDPTYSPLVLTIKNWNRDNISPPPFCLPEMEEVTDDVGVGASPVAGRYQLGGTVRTSKF